MDSLSPVRRLPPIHYSWTHCHLSDVCRLYTIHGLIATCPVSAAYTLFMDSLPPVRCLPPIHYSWTHCHLFGVCRQYTFHGLIATCPVSATYTHLMDSLTSVRCAAYIQLIDSLTADYCAAYRQLIDYFPWQPSSVCRWSRWQLTRWTLSKAHGSTRHVEKVNDFLPELTGSLKQSATSWAAGCRTSQTVSVSIVIFSKLNICISDWMIE